MPPARSFAFLTLLIGLTSCTAPPVEPHAEPLAAGQARGGGTGTDPRPTDPPLTPASAETRLQGVVTEVPSRLGTAAFLIEEYPDRPMGPGASPLNAGGKFHVRVNESTVIRRRGEDGRVGSATLADIEVGTRAEVWFVGPILESYPAQGTASRIMIFDWVP